MTKERLLKRWLPPLLIILAGVLAYWNSFDGVFLYDDITAIRDNPHIRVLWPISEAMSLPLWNTAFTVDGRPLLSLSFALNHALFGPEPWGYHLVNLLIHICAGLLLFGIVRRTIRCQGAGVRGQGGHETGVALAVALIWLVHPLQTESVTYIVQRAESLMGMLFLATLYCAIRAFARDEEVEQKVTKGTKREGPRRALHSSQSDGRTPTGPDLGRHGGRPSHDFRFAAPLLTQGQPVAPRAAQVSGLRFSLWRVAAIAACATGMGVKQTMFSAPLLVLLYDWAFVSGGFGAALRKRKVFYGSLFATWLIVFGTIAVTWAEATSDFVRISPIRYLMTQPLVLLYYMRLSVWPSPLVLSYGWQLEDSWVRIVFPGLLILGMLAVMIRGIRHRRWYGFILAWFFFILAPTSSIAPMRQAISEHRMYLSLAAVVILAVLGFEYILRKLAAEEKPRRLVGAGMLIAAVLMLAASTRDRNALYHSSLEIWRDNLRHRVSPFAHNDVGWSLHKQGKNQQAAGHLREALRLKPDFAQAHNNLGNALQALGQPAEALPHYQEAVRLDPDYANAHNNWGLALHSVGRTEESIARYRDAIRLKPDIGKIHYNLGNAFMALGRIPEAIDEYRAAIRLEPARAEAYYNLGVALSAGGQVREAFDCYTQAVKHQPDYAEAYNNMGNLCLLQGKPKEAIPYCRKALWINPGLAEAAFNLGNALVAVGSTLDGAQQYRQAVSLKPDYAQAHHNLGLALRHLGELDAAIVHGQVAVKIRPEDAIAHNDLGLSYLAKGQTPEAIRRFEEALRLSPEYPAARENLRKAKEAGK